MVNVFNAKVRRLGNSHGIIIPNDVMKTNGISNGDTVKVVLPKYDLKVRNEKILKVAGKFKGLPPFERDREDRF